MGRLLSLTVFFLGFIVISSYAITVQSIQCGRGVKNRSIIQPSDNFTVGERVWCLTVLKDIKKPTYIIHRWVLGNRHFDVKLKVQPYKRYRTWSYKTIYPSMKGVWKLEVLDSNGKLLKEKIFVVK